MAYIYLLNLYDEIEKRIDLLTEKPAADKKKKYHRLKQVNKTC